MSTGYKSFKFVWAVFSENTGNVKDMFIQVTGPEKVWMEKLQSLH